MGKPKTIRINSKIATVLKKACKNNKYGDGTVLGLTTIAIKYFINKHEKCFCCPYHIKQVSSLELERQIYSLNPNSEETKKGAWILCDSELLLKLETISSKYDRPMRTLLEQILLEHLTRPIQCSKCKYYKEMSMKVN